jgi:hypothetical protein
LVQVLPFCTNGDNAIDSFLQHEEEPGFEEFHVLGNGTVRKTTCCCSDDERSLPGKKPQASITVLPSNKQSPRPRKKHALKIDPIHFDNV